MELLIVKNGGLDIDVLTYVLKDDFDIKIVLKENVVHEVKENEPDILLFESSSKSKLYDEVELIDDI